MQTHPLHLFKYLLLFAVMLLGWGAKAQLTEKYSTINWLQKSSLFSAIDSLSNPDTVPDRFQIYNPLYRNQVAFLDQGVIGSASQGSLFGTFCDFRYLKVDF